MSDTPIKGLHIRLPIDLIRQAKIAAVREDKPVQDWFKEAAEAKLRLARETEAA